MKISRKPRVRRQFARIRARKSWWGDGAGGPINYSRSLDKVVALGNADAEIAAFYKAVVADILEIGLLSLTPGNAT